MWQGEKGLSVKKVSDRSLVIMTHGCQDDDNVMKEFRSMTLVALANLDDGYGE